MKWSVGRSKFGQTELVLDTPWDEFVSFLRDIAQAEHDPSEKDEHAWAAPFILKEGAERRTLDDVDHMSSWLALDLDSGNLTLTDIRLRLAGLRFIAYTTASSRPDAQKWRVIIQLNRESSIGEHAGVWRYFASKFPGSIDTKVFNANRIFYCPATWDGSDNVFFASEAGTAACVDSLCALIAHVSEPANAIPIDHNAVLKPAPDGTVMISATMIAQAQAAPVGGRMYRLLAQVAKRFRVSGWDLQAGDLEDAAQQANAMFAPGKRRPNLNRECQRAITWAERNFQPQSPIEKLRNRILWQQHRFGPRKP